MEKFMMKTVSYFIFCKRQALPKYDKLNK